MNDYSNLQRYCERCGKTKPIEMFAELHKPIEEWSSVCRLCKAPNRSTAKIIASIEARLVKKALGPFGTKGYAKAVACGEVRRLRKAQRVKEGGGYAKAVARAEVQRAAQAETQGQKNAVARVKAETKGAAKARAHAAAKALIKAQRSWNDDQYFLQRLDTRPATKQELDDLLKAQNYLCAYCKRTVDLTKDHIFPESRGGGDEISNMCWACGKCNSSKGDKTPDEWTDRWYLRKK